MRTGRIIQNPASGERIVLRRTAAETGGQLFEFELHLAPGGRVPAGHLHPEQEERFTVLDGRVRFHLRRQSVIAAVGETVTVLPGVAHSFVNAGPAPARLLVEARPALHMEELLETAAQLGSTPGPVELALFLREFDREVRAPILPRLVAAAVRPVAWIGRRGGLDAPYRRLRDGTRSP
ncbi:MAG: cupin domain-containing protein [Candidatus Dormibacteraeota bacterium]|uniref:Cupin domain-containing protein n=1 Tax=Candidatus Dormiibacter inghamiae TaxID=3127013 RepID=A0A934KG47_9BACT|nr:cupin domain-containing protein [Candidatus Dormibacteraeota bacterium]MBJ7606965.1 cupin domain-containing protein [Candidatus Dormibacteraeota bacterium]